MSNKLTTEKDNGDFWKFSLSYYSSVGIENACLYAQETHALDVNLLLFCCWHARCERVIDLSLLTKSQQLSKEWNKEVVQALRNIQHYLKPIELKPTGNMLHSSAIDSIQAAKLREEIKTQEIESERIQQYALESLYLNQPNTLPTLKNISECCYKNLASYLQLEGIELAQFKQQHLHCLMAATANQAA